MSACALRPDERALEAQELAGLIARLPAEQQALLAGPQGSGVRNAADVLVTGFNVAGKWRHGTDVDGTFGVVYAGGRGEDLNVALEYGHSRCAPSTIFRAVSGISRRSTR